MKRILLVIFVFCFFAVSSFSQNDSDKVFSVEIDYQYYYYYYSGVENNLYNYGYSAVFYYMLSKQKIGLGINYTSKDHFKDITSVSPPKSKITYSIKQLNIPALIEYCILKRENHNTYILGGLVLNSIIDYSVVYHWDDGHHTNINNVDIDNKIGLSVRIGFGIQRDVFKDLRISLSTFIDTKIIYDHYTGYPTRFDIPDNRFSFGVQIGILYLFKKMNN